MYDYFTMTTNIPYYVYCYVIIDISFVVLLDYCLNAKCSRYFFIMSFYDLFLFSTLITVGVFNCTLVT